MTADERQPPSFYRDGVLRHGGGHLGHILRELARAGFLERRENGRATPWREPSRAGDRELRHVDVMQVPEAFLEARCRFGHRCQVSREGLGEDFHGVAKLLVSNAEIVQPNDIVRGCVAAILDPLARGPDHTASELAELSVAVGPDRKRQQRMQERACAIKLAVTKSSHEAPSQSLVASHATSAPRVDSVVSDGKPIERLDKCLFIAELPGRRLKCRERPTHGVGVKAAEDRAGELEQGTEAPQCDPQIVNRLRVLIAEDARERSLECGVECPGLADNERSRAGLRLASVVGGVAGGVSARVVGGLHGDARLACRA